MAAQLWIDRTKEFRTPIVADGWSCQTWEVCCCRENGWTKKATIKISRRLLFIPIFYEWYKKIPYSLSIRLYFDQLINLKSIRKADKSKLSCAILIKIYREVPGTLRNHGLRAILLYLYESTKMTEAVSEIAGYLRLVLLHKT